MSKKLDVYAMKKIEKYQGDHKKLKRVTVVQLPYHDVVVYVDEKGEYWASWYAIGD